jgi:hypothetical protein
MASPDILEKRKTVPVPAIEPWTILFLEYSFNFTIPSFYTILCQTHK